MGLLRIAALAMGMLVVANMAVARASPGSQTYWVEQVAENLNFPSSMAWLPDGDVLITERMGGLRILRRGTLDPKPLEGIPQIYRGIYDGLKDIALDPDFRTNRTLYLFLSEGTFEQHHAAVYRARFGAHGLEDATQLFRSSEGVGGAAITVTTRMVLLADRTLLLGVAEDHAQPRAQRLDSQMGKFLRINLDGSIPKDNPFVNTPGALAEIWSYGHRVPTGLYQDPQTGAIWEVEPGPRGGDELNVLKPGANYGWAQASWGFPYAGGGLEAPWQSGPGIEQPLQVWMPSITPSGLTRFRGKEYPLWDGDYFIGNLSGKAFMRLRIEGREVILQERMLMDLDERIRDVKTGPDNHIYMLTDNSNGRLLRLRSGQPRAAELGRVARKLEQRFSLVSIVGVPLGGDEKLADLTPADIAHGRQAFLERCAACHSVGAIVQGGQIGPDLKDLYGGLMGRKPGFDYSLAMAGGLVQWKFSALDLFLVEPSKLVPGTKMAAPPVTDSRMRQNIIGFLKQQSSQ